MIIITVALLFFFSFLSCDLENLSLLKPLQSCFDLLRTFCFLIFCLTSVVLLLFLSLSSPSSRITRWELDFTVNCSGIHRFLTTFGFFSLYLRRIFSYNPNKCYSVHIGRVQQSVFTSIFQSLSLIRNVFSLLIYFFFRITQSLMVLE